MDRARLKLSESTFAMVAVLLLTFHGGEHAGVSQDIWQSISSAGYGSFHSVSNGLRFQVRVVEPYSGPFTACLTSPTSTNVFDLGDGTSRYFTHCELVRNPFLPPEKLDQWSCGLLTEGTQYAGFFEISDSLRNDLEKGVTEFSLLSETEEMFSGSMNRATIPQLRVEQISTNNVVTWDSDGQCFVNVATTLNGEGDWLTATNIRWKGESNILVHPTTNSVFFYRLGWFSSP